jgi:hypothetical protein
MQTLRDNSRGVGLVSIAVLFPIAAIVIGQARMEDRISSPEAPKRIVKFQERAPTEQTSGQGAKILVARPMVQIQKPALSILRNAATSRLWNNDGSLARLEAIGRTRRFYYTEPDQGSPAKPGTIVFEGVREGPTFSGRAFSFSADCAPLAYPVKGSVNRDETAVKLRGRKPLRDGACKIVGYGDQELNFVMEASAAK